MREYVERLGRSDPAAFDLVADHFVQHAAGPRGRDGLRQTVQMLEHDRSQHRPSSSTWSPPAIW